MYPVMIPLGSSGGDHMIFTVLEVTSGNQSLTGGPGTEISNQWHYKLFNLYYSTIQTLNIMKLWVGRKVFALADVVISKSGPCIKNYKTHKDQNSIL